MGFRHQFLAFLKGGRARPRAGARLLSKRQLEGAFRQATKLPLPISLVVLLALVAIGGVATTTQGTTSHLPANQSRPPPAFNPLAPVPSGFANTQSLYCAGTGKPYVALTFDDGPGPQTQQTVDELRQAGQRATFFLVGRNAQAQPGAARGELAVASVEDHTYDHADLTRLSQDPLTDELARTKGLIQQQTGQAPTLFRPPYGAYNQTVVQDAQSLGMHLVLWNDDSRDSEGAPADKIVQNVEAGLTPGSIIIMHENKPETQKALPQILQAIRQRGLTSVSIPELLAFDPPTPQQLQAGPRTCPFPGAHPQGKKVPPTT